MERAIRKDAEKKPTADLSAELLDLLHVRTFVAIADYGAFLAAAHALGVAQPTVSQHIAKLEARLDAQLLRRHRGLCSLTPEGEKLLPHARSLLLAESRCRVALGQTPLRVSASSNIGTYHLPRLLRRFESTAGQPEIEVTIGTNLDVYRRVESHEADVGLTEWWDKRNTLDAVQWYEEPLIVIAPCDHPWAAKRHVTPRELLATPMVAGESGTGTASLLRQMFPEAKNLRVSMTLGSTEGVKQAVIAGLGVSLVMKTAVEAELASGRLVAVSLTGKKIKKPLFAVFQRGIAATSPVARFVQFVRAGRHPG